MELVLICVLLALLFNWLSKKLQKLSEVLAEEDSAKKVYNDRTLRALERLSEPDEDPNEPRTTLDCFLEGNKRIITKNAIRKAIEEERGLD